MIPSSVPDVKIVKERVSVPALRPVYAQNSNRISDDALSLAKFTMVS